VLGRIAVQTMMMLCTLGNINSDSERDSNVGSIAYHNSDDDNANGILDDESSRTTNDEEEEK